MDTNQITLDSLQKSVQEIAAFIENNVKNATPEKLSQRPAPDKWNVLECMEHLNRYSRYYNPALQKAIAKAPGATATEPVSLTWVGQKAVDSITPKNTKNQTTLKRMNPLNQPINRSVVEAFLKHQQELAAIIEKAQQVSIRKKAVPIEFFKLMKMNIGETILFMVLHEQRHLNQIKNLLSQN